MFKFKIGTVVRHKSKNIWGHVIGFALNPINETVITVRWADGNENMTHPANVDVEQNND